MFYILITSLCLSGCPDDIRPARVSDEVDDLGTFISSRELDKGSEIPLPRFDLTVESTPCDPNPCPAKTRCVVEEVVIFDMLDHGLDQGGSQQEYICVPLTCEEITCQEIERCEESDEGALCVSMSSLGDDSCFPQEHCLDGQCIPDLCVTSERRCSGDLVESCDLSGAGFVPLYQCDSTHSQCVESGAGDAFCGCQEDWDCPEYMRCEAGGCVGRPSPPECLLPPAPFEESLPAPEIQWGGTADQNLAMGSPFPESVQVVMTPLVANLTDDNGDGVIDDQDIPEVIFMSFCASSFTKDGALRAIHGGGPFKGADLFTTLGDHHWYEGDPFPEEMSYQCSDGELDPTAGLAVGDLDDPATSDGRVEIIAIHQQNGLVIYNHRGEVIERGFIREMPNVGSNPTISITQMDQRGMAEIVVGNLVFTLARDDQGVLKVIDQFRGRLGEGRNGQGAISCVADLTGDGIPEVIGGATVYQLPPPPNGATRRADCESQGGMVIPQNEEEEAWCEGELLVLWDGPDVNSDLNESIRREGFCAVADIMGADRESPPSPQNPLDGAPEVIVISNGTLYIYDGATGVLRLKERYSNTNTDRGGAPNIDDFDGDGFPEIGSAFAQGYLMMDLQPPTPNCPEWPELIDDGAEEQLQARPPRTPGPEECVEDAECFQGEAVCRGGACVCLHNGWSRSTEDNSSKVTGSTLFDFNGDGAAEVIYNDECFFRVYDGRDGTTLFSQPSESRTRVEHPIVADVDNDGNAEIIFSTSTESGFCSIRGQADERGVRYRDQYNPGLEVWGDPQDRWVPARRIWNQHAYHITHITESGGVPLIELPGWVSTNGRTYNSYRAQPRSYGVAPDLQIDILRAKVNSDCEGEAQGVVTISAQVHNHGEVRVGDGIRMTFEGRWAEPEGSQEMSAFQPLLTPAGDPLTTRTQAGLNPDGALMIYVSYDPTLDPSLDASYNGAPPIEIIAHIDQEEGSDFGRERECREDNNDAHTEVLTSGGLPELELTLLEVEHEYCPDLTLKIEVKNTGVLPVERTTLSLYAGDPRQGGGRLDRYELMEPLRHGDRQEIIWETDRFPSNREILFYIAIDPANLIEECNEENNLISFDERLSCEQRDGQ